MFFLKVNIRWFYWANGKRALQIPKFALQGRAAVCKACYFAVSKNQYRPPKERAAVSLLCDDLSKASFLGIDKSFC